MDGLAPASTGPATGPQFDNRRVLAALIDLALLVPVALLMSALFGGFTDAAVALTLGWALYYYFACESDHGQTIGKRVMKIRVARADGQPLDLGRVAVRTLLRPIDAIGAYLVGLVVMLATGKRRQRLGDLAAGTVVTDADAPTRPEPEQSVAEVPEAPVIESPPMPSEPIADTGLDPRQVPEMRPFEPFAEPEPEPEPMAEPEPEPIAEVEPVVEAEPEPSLDDIVPVDRPEEPEPPTDEPVPVPQETDEEPEEEPPSPSRLEIVSSPIDLVMQDHDEPDPPQDPPRDSA
jgi:uncharacterized RDD family membrane protein YckC